MTKMLTIGQLAKMTNTTSVAIRYYEKQGLIPKSKRSEAGYRLYSDNLIALLHFIKNAKAVGFSLGEIKELLLLQQNYQAPSKVIKDLTLSKIEKINVKIQTLNLMHETLVTWTDACDGKVPIKECPILENLYGIDEK